MLKRFCLCLIVCLLFLPAGTALADVVFEPENDFYKQHQREILYLGRSFVANGEGGNVPIQNAPNSRGLAGSIQNGRSIYIQYSCLFDGEYWGFSEQYSGWVKLEQMLVLYDYVSFQEKFGHDFYTYSGEYERISEARGAVAWLWPGTDSPPLWTYEDLDADSFWVQYAYMDEDGREWGFVTYLYGRRNIWVCLSDPLNRDIPAFNPATEPEVWVSDTEHTNIKKTNDPMIIIILVLVAALAIGTVVLIKAFWKPK